MQKFRKFVGLFLALQWCRVGLLYIIVFILLIQCLSTIVIIVPSNAIQTTSNW